MIKKNKSDKVIKDRKFSFSAYAEGMVLGATEIKNEFVVDGKTVIQRYVEVSVVDDENTVFYLKDKSMERMEMYKRGDHGVFELAVSVTEGFKGKTELVINEYIPASELELKTE